MIHHSQNGRPRSFLRTGLLQLLLLLTGLVIVPPAPAPALEMSSKRDCVVCHVMWLNDFRTEKETLIDWEPTNVLMRDTQGVVSSEEICYSCHDGYVNDSRYVTWKYNRHKVYVKPSKNVSIPHTMPLSVHGEIYCGTCHSAHGKGAAPHGNPMGLTSFFRETKIDSTLCEQCHRNESAYERTNGHPVHTSKRRLPEQLFDLGSKRAEKKDTVICQTCHKVHGARGEKILIVSNRNSDLCVLCHEDQKTLVGTKHDLRITLPEEKNIKDRSVSESGPCSGCHTPHNSAGKKLWARQLGRGNPASEMCLTCHSEESGYKIKGIGAYSHPIDVKPDSDTPIPPELPLFSSIGATDPAGNVQCFTCHNVHRWDPDKPEEKGSGDEEGDSSNSFLRIANNSMSDLCLECHSTKNQIITSDHNLAITAPEERNSQGFETKVSGPCGACHIPHNAEADHIWARPLSGDRDFVTQLCTGCHNETGSAKAKLTGENTHPVDVNLERFNITTTLPLYDEKGTITPDGRMVCITCHDPHTWDPNGTVLLNDGQENREGDASNSFLRKSNFPSSELCKSCHEKSAFVDGTDHDLTITAPDARNLLGQTATESGQCGVCHLVHNSPNRLKLWARTIVPRYRGDEMINNLCMSCHTTGEVAQSKIPRIATHPDEKLINNILRSDRSALDFAPMFDKEGKEISVGNLSCPTCHNAHQWNPLHNQGGSGKNVEGNATNSFLRNVSYNNICIDCHGLDALFRFKYFHNPEERIEASPLMTP